MPIPDEPFDEDGIKDWEKVFWMFDVFKQCERVGVEFEHFWTWVVLREDFEAEFIACAGKAEAIEIFGDTLVTAAQMCLREAVELGTSSA